MLLVELPPPPPAVPVVLGTPVVDVADAGAPPLIVVVAVEAADVEVGVVVEELRLSGVAAMPYRPARLIVMMDGWPKRQIPVKLTVLC